MQLKSQQKEKLAAMQQRKDAILTGAIFMSHLNSEKVLRKELPPVQIEPSTPVRADRADRAEAVSERHASTVTHEECGKK